MANTGAKATAALFFMLSATAVAAPPAKAAEYDVKAAFLYNFAKFVEWPNLDPTRPIAICVLGANPFGDKLTRAVEGKRVDGREVEVRSLPTVKGADTCQIVFVASSERERVEDIVGQLGQRPVLTVSDVEGFADRGGVIGLKLQESKVRFEVNMDAARLAGLKLSSQLLKVATQVIGQVEALSPP
jgi:hypothetical protein